MKETQAFNMSSSVNGDCTELYKDAKKFCMLVQKSLSKCEQDLNELLNTKTRQEVLLAPTNVGKLKALHNAEPMLEGIRTCISKIVFFEKRFIVLAKDEKSCKKTLFFRARHMIMSLEKAKLSLVLILQRYINAFLSLIAGRNVLVSSASDDWLHALQTVDGYNQILTEFHLVNGQGSDSGKSI